MLHLLHLLQRYALLHAFHKLTIFRGHDFCRKIVPYLEIVYILLLFCIRRVEAKMGLREPFRQVNCKWIAILTLQYHVLVLVVFKQNERFIYYRVTLLDRLDLIGLRLIWHVKDHLFFTLELKLNIFHVNDVVFSVNVNCAVEGLA